MRSTWRGLRGGRIRRSFEFGIRSSEFGMPPTRPDPSAPRPFGRFAQDDVLNGLVGRARPHVILNSAYPPDAVLSFTHPTRSAITPSEIPRDSWVIGIRGRESTGNHRNIGGVPCDEATDYWKHSQIECAGSSSASNRLDPLAHPDARYWMRDARSPYPPPAGETPETHREGSPRGLTER